MSARTLPSNFRFEKRRADALVHLTSGETRHGCFFVAGASAHHVGQERIGDLLNGETGFVPFEVHEATGPRIVLLNRAHILTVAVADDEASRDPGYVVAPRHIVSIRLSTGQHVTGLVRVYRPEGHDRLSDWTREPEVFRYVETGTATLLVNMAHVVEASEAGEP